MLLTSPNTQIESSGITTSKTFGIESNAKAFKALSDNLYSNKIGSLVREICSNAKDSHSEAGYPDRPFTVHLPCSLEPWFSVQDTGLGMSQEKIFSIFAIYFSSTKDLNNDNLGGYGIGAKTPFVYTDSFTIESVFEGKLGTYIAFLGKNGSPEISLFQEVPTDQPNGVTIKVPTLKSADHHNFREELRSQLKFFEPKPNVINGNSFKFEDLNFSLAFKSCGARLLKTNRPLFRTLAVCGGISYSIDINLLCINIDTGYYRSLIDCFHPDTLILDFSIGELDLALSKESLSYTVKTSNAIVLKLEALRAETEKWILKSLNSLSTKWDQAVFIAKNARLLNLTGIKQSNYLKQSKAIGVLKGTFHDCYLLDLQDTTSIVDGKACVVPTNRIFRKLGLGRTELTSRPSIAASKEVHLVYNDFPLNFRKRILDWEKTFTKAGTYAEFYYIEPINRNLTATETDAIIKKISYSMGAVPIVKASDLPYIKGPTQTKTKVAKCKYYKFTPKSKSNFDRFSLENWEQGFDDLTANSVGGYYILVKNRSFVEPESRYGLKLQVYNMLDRPIYAVKQETLNKIESSPIWVKLKDYSREFYTQLLNNPDCQKVYIRESRMPSSYRNTLKELLLRQKWPENSVLSNLARLVSTLEAASLPPIYNKKITLVLEAFELYDKLGLGDGLRNLVESWDYQAFFGHHYHLMDKLLQNLRSIDERTLEEITDYLIKNPK